MMPRSLATYMNAWTANDFTQYPFSTQNSTDYYNLMSVYLDSVFKPILSEYDFSQEGWRIEKNAETKEWEFKGIVFNEMKGVFSDHGAVYYYDHQKHLYEGCVYNQVSGGHPLNIPELTWEHLKKFHDDHYHPNNAKIFTFGNFPLDQHLSKLNEKLTHTLETSPKPSPLPSFATHPTWDAPRKVVVKGPFDPMLNPEQQHKISVSWLTNEVTDTFTTMSLGLLFSLLTGTSGAPLQKALLDTHLGTEYSPTTGYNAQSPITSFSIGVQGVNPSNLEKIEKAIYETLETVSKEGFSKDLIEGALLNIELSFRHRGSNFGIRLVQSIMNNWNYGLNPLDPLEIDQVSIKI
jgi:Zn-dependent M16 (insulinase) family peptidase